MITTADLRSTFLFDSLSDDQIATLIEKGEEVTFGESDVLFEEGQPADFFWVFLEGRVEMLRRTQREERDNTDAGNGHERHEHDRPEEQLA